MEKVLCVFLVILAFSWAEKESPVVKITHGTLKGSVLTSRLGRSIFSFRGIPYAKPPLGKLRFQPPVPVGPWGGILDATQDGPSCPPSETGSTQILRSEDCLILNVYTPELPGNEDSRKKPVIVFIHPGAWYSFTSNSRMFGPQYMLDHDVVLVTMNYRLAALGFLSTNDKVLSGNYGMKDQVVALRWVKQNIAAFGGDPDSVTLAGYSAGSASVMMHMVSPMSRGLFHRAIASSGSAFSLWALQTEPFRYAKRFAQLFNCSAETSQQIKDCFMDKDAQEMANSVFQLAEWANTPSVIFAPVIETETEGERFLVEHPIDSFCSGNFAQVPLILGMTTDEVAWGSLTILNNKSWTEDINRNPEYVLPIVFGYERNTPRSHYITKELWNLYFQNQQISNSTESQFAKMFRDGVVCYGMDVASKIISKISQSPVYYYKFSYQGRFSWVYKRNTALQPYGVVHHDDLMYWFYIDLLFPFFTPEYPEVKTVERLTTMWANFATSGNPIPTTTDLLQNTLWEPFTVQNLKYLDVGSNLNMKSGLYQDTLPKWGKLLYPNLFRNDGKDDQSSYNGSSDKTMGSVLNNSPNAKGIYLIIYVICFLLHQAFSHF